MIRDSQHGEKNNKAEEEPLSAVDGKVNSAEARDDARGEEMKTKETDAFNGEYSGSIEEEERFEGDTRALVADLKKKLKEKTEEAGKVKEEVESLKDLLLRRQADFENYKKRMIKSQDEYRKSAIKDISLDIIGINDNLLRAIEASETVTHREGSCSDSHSSFVEGVSMISRSIDDMLKKYGVVEIESLNREFDPNLNEAVEINESNEVENDIITKVYLRGYVLDELVIRPAKVRVSRPAKNLKTGEKNDVAPPGDEGHDRGDDTEKSALN